MTARERPFFRFGEFVLVPSERVLVRDGAPVSLSGKPFDLLVALVHHAGHLVTKDELLAEVWPGLVVEEIDLSVNMSALRRALGDAADASGWIETVPRCGYRFNAPVEVGHVTAADLARIRGFERLAHVPASGDSADREAPDEIESPRIASSMDDCPAKITLGLPGTPAPEQRSRHAHRSALLVGIALLAAVAVAALLLWPASRPLDSIAVLPFTSTEPESVILARGISDGVNNALSTLTGLRVTPRASAARFAGTPDDLRRTALALGVAALATGTLSETGDGIRVQIDVVDAGRNAQVFGRAYRVPRDEVPALEQRIARDIASALGVIPLRRDETRPPATANAAAYQAYVTGRYFWNQRGEAALRRAIDAFRRALELDPSYAQAHAGLADAYSALGYLGFDAPVSTFPVARPYALKALELDPSLAEAHASLAYIKFYFDWDWAGAEAEFRQAIALEPGNPTARQWHAVYLLAAGQADAAMSEVLAAQRLDPLSLAIATDVGFHHYYNRRYEQAVAQLRSVLEMDDAFALAHLWLGRALQETGRSDEALAHYAVVEGKARAWPVAVAARAFALGRAGRTADAVAALDELDALSRSRFVTAYGMALASLGLGRNDDALQWLERAFDERSHWLVWLRLDPRFDSLRPDPRFAALLERMRYPK